MEYSELKPDLSGSRPPGHSPQRAARTANTLPRFLFIAVTDREPGLSPSQMLFVHAIAVGIVLLGCLVIDDVATFLIFGGIVAFVTYAFLGAAEARRCPIWFDPISVYLLWYSIVFGLCAIYAGFSMTSDKTFNLSVIDIESDTLPWAFCISLLGSLALHAGLALFRPTRSDDPAAASQDGIGGIRSIAVLWLLGQATRWMPSIFAPLGNIKNALLFGSIGAASSLALRSSEELGLASSAFSAFFVIADAGVLFSGIASGMKAEAMFALLPTAWFFLKNLEGRTMRAPLIVSIAVAVLLYFSVVQPAIQGYRAIAQKEYRDSTTPLANMYEAWASGASKAAAGDFAERLDHTSERLSEFVPVAYFVGQVRDRGLQMGATMGYALYAMVPRIIWPNKPAVTRGAWFSVYIGFARSEDKAFSLGMTAIGELYWNFGLAGVFLGMLLIGALHACIWRTAGLDPRRKPLHMTFYTLTLFSVHEMAEAGTTINGTLAYIIIFRAILALIHQWSIRTAGIDPHSGSMTESHDFAMLPHASNSAIFTR
jgi:hypothetical protein